jgi:hypothetical protein
MAETSITPPDGTTSWTEYAVQHTEFRRGSYRTVTTKPHRNLAAALMSMEETRDWQQDNVLCPRVDAVVVTRTVTATAWTPRLAYGPEVRRG